MSEAFLTLLKPGNSSASWKRIHVLSQFYTAECFDDAHIKAVVGELFQSTDIWSISQEASVNTVSHSPRLCYLLPEHTRLLFWGTGHIK